MAEDWSRDVLAFWFGDLKAEDWFASNPELDRNLAERFGPVREKVAAAAPPSADADADLVLATVIVLDQFPRNMFRGKPAAFETDDLALRIARGAIERGLDETLPAERKRFLYMPFMHSETLADQERGLDLFKRLGDEETVRYAEEHRDIIQRFGRFPHRNRVLGRTSTAAERAFLLSHEGFGQ